MEGVARTMQSITIEIPDNLYEQLRERTHASQQNVEDAIKSLLIRVLFETFNERPHSDSQGWIMYLETVVLFYELRDRLDRLQQEERGRRSETSYQASAVQGVVSTPNVNGGEPCIVRTRIPVWTLVRSRELGLREAEILLAYPTLTAEDLVNAWSYAELHSDAIAAQIAENEAA